MFIWHNTGMYDPGRVDIPEALLESIGRGAVFFVLVVHEENAAAGLNPPP